MEEKELIETKNKKMKVCKVATFVLLALAFVFIGLMIAWLLVRKNNATATLILSIICAVILVGILSMIAVYFINKKKADQIQNEIDNI